MRHLPSGPRPSRQLSHAAAAMSIILASTAAVAAASADGFHAQMAAAMDRMNHDMHAGHDGDPDRAFAAMMIPHHQGAVEMAELELRYGSDERLRRLAQGIIVSQHQEMRVMRDILASNSQPTETPAGSGHPAHHGAGR